jgi:antiviral helicase SKI2
LVGYEEVEISSLGETAKNSLSLNRAPGAKDEGLKGSSTNFPFWPGGFDEEKELLQSSNKIEALQIDENEAILFEKLFEKGIISVACKIYILYYIVILASLSHCFQTY